jgi:hypothetical protein
MKGSRLYLIFLFAFFIFVFLSEYWKPHQFSWKPTYDKYDREPFGSYVFDDIVSSSFDRYTVSNKTFYQIFTDDSTASPRAFLLTEDRLRFTDTDIDYLFRLLEKGDQLMICTSDFPFRLKDTLGFGTSTQIYYQTFNFGIKKDILRDSIFFGTDTLNPERIFEVYPDLHPASLEAGWSKYEYDSIQSKSIEHFYPMNCDSTQILAWDNKKRPLVIRTFIGKGELFLVSTPLMFTNYGMLDDTNASYAFRLLSFLKDKPLTRVEAYGVNSQKSRTPLRYILTVTPLRWTFYWTLALLILFMVFTAKRRQRIIPVIQSPPNRIFEFMQLISNLYYQKHDNGEMLKMKYTCFCSQVKSLIGVDLQENIPDESNYVRLSEKTGTDYDLMCQLLKNIRIVIYRSEATDVQLKQYIDGMNDLLRALKS